MDDDANENNAANYRINNYKATTSRTFECETKIIENAPADNNTFDSEVVVPLKYLSNFWKYLDLPLVNCEIELDLSWSDDCIISETLRSAAVAANAAANSLAESATSTTVATFQTNFMLW